MPTKNKILPVILCGGSGTRLWPLSRQAYPKQLLPLVSKQSMLQDTLLRLSGLQGLLPPIVICNEAHRFIVAEQLREIGIKNPKIILEPCAKNTAPAIAIAALAADKDSLLLVLSADQQIKNKDAFCTAVVNAKAVAEKDYLVTFGVQPEHPETGYGYIKKSKPLDGLVSYQVEQFVEKPTLEKAKEYVESGEYYWNSGMFMFRASVYLQELQQFSPSMVASCQQAITKSKKDLDFVRLDSKAFDSCPNDSVDYAVMEKSNKVVVVPLLGSGWSDLGSWSSIYDSRNKDANNNVIEGDVCAENVTNSYLHSESRLLAVVGVSDHVIVETADVVLVAHKDAVQDVKKLVKQLEANKRAEVENHHMVCRPWGYYEVIDGADQFQVKHIMVKPGASLSLQMHHHRSEHWVIIQGTAEVVRGDQQLILEKNQSIDIPIKAKHRLKNIGTDDLIIIEVQTGSYLGEDDIVRFEDCYGRVAEH